jgi:hypothetical protein
MGVLCNINIRRHLNVNLKIKLGGRLSKHKGESRDRPNLLKKEVDKNLTITILKRLKEKLIIKY